jgi:hypothetical protein
MESEAGDPAPAPPKLVVTQIDDYAQLTEELANLPDGQMITVVHYSTAWTEERTGTARTASELGTILEMYQGIGMYVKVANARTAIRMGVTVVPTFEFYRGRDKVDQCSGADMYLTSRMPELRRSARPSARWRLLRWNLTRPRRWCGRKAARRLA